MSSVTIKEVAKEANVSFSTVSRVIRNAKNVHPKTRKKVLRAIKKLNYHVDAGARGMVKRQTKTIGVCISDISNPFYPLLVRGVENTINKFGYNLLLCNTDENGEKEEVYLKLILEKRVDGLIIAPTGQDISYLKEFTRRNIPIVFIDRKTEGIPADAVCADNVQGAFSAVEHLIKLGHKRVAMIAGLKAVTTTQERIQGYLEALRAYHIKADDSLMVEGSSKIEGGIKATEVLFKLSSPPTAIFSSNNLMTLGALVALKRLGKNVPKDVAIVGFDDLEWAEVLNSPLTAVSQPTYTIGTTAAQLLIQRLLGEGPAKKQTIVLKTELIIRRSCGFS
ncbi:MAG: LacI family DNA-binding transcriptional regulator [Candidatus Aerophobetes bacterium]|nr:LacI family DNA-binding transcriptional regulator [Candidatus Aerophobetes bacterium]